MPNSLLFRRERQCRRDLAREMDRVLSEGTDNLSDNQRENIEVALEESASLDDLSEKNPVRAALIATQKHTLPCELGEKACRPGHRCVPCMAREALGIEEDAEWKLKQLEGLLWDYHHARDNGEAAEKAAVEFALNVGEFFGETWWRGITKKAPRPVYKPS